MSRNRKLSAAVNPLLTILNLYGVNWNAERNIFKKIFQLVIVVILLSFYARGLYLSILWIGSMKNIYVGYTMVAFLEQHMSNLNAASYALCLFKWREMSELVRLTHRCFLHPQQFARLKWGSLLFVSLPCILLFLIRAYVCVWSFQQLSAEQLFHNFRAYLMELLYHSPLFFLPTLCFYICATVYYIKMTFQDLLMEVKRSKSAVRRAKLTARLLSIYHRLTTMAKRINAAGACSIYLMIAAFPILFCFAVNVVYVDIQTYEWDFVFTFQGMYLMPVQLVLVALAYVPTASFVNHVASSIAWVLVETITKNDNWNASDPSLRFYLLNMEMNHVDLAQSLSMGDGRLTLLTDPIDNESLFLLFVETINTFTYVTGKLMSDDDIVIGGMSAWKNYW